MFRKIILYLVFVVVSNYSIAQSTQIDSVRQVLQNVNKVFDSAAYLKFDVDIYLNSDTVLGISNNDHVKATYVLHGNNIYYKVFGMEFMQNDTIAVNIYNDDKLMYITKRNESTASSNFPVKLLSDSVLQYYFNDYEIHYNPDTLVEGGIKLDFKTDTPYVPYTRISIAYDGESYIPYRFQFTFMDLLDVEENDSTPVVDSLLLLPVRKTLKFEFSNYGFVENLDAFNPDMYCRFNYDISDFEAVKKYLGYKVIAAGIENATGDRTDIELPVPPEAYEDPN